MNFKKCQFVFKWKLHLPLGVVVICVILNQTNKTILTLANAHYVNLLSDQEMFKLHVQTHTVNVIFATDTTCMKHLPSNFSHFHANKIR